MAFLYWIRKQDHLDIFTQGYIGVTKNIESRFYRHKYDANCKMPPNMKFKRAIDKYSFEKLLKSVVLEANENYCYEIEAKLRSSKNIGWNINIGGTKPPISTNRGPNYISPLLGKSRPKFTKEHRKNMSLAHKNKYTRGTSIHAKKLIHNEIEYNCIMDYAEANNLKFSTAYARLSRNPERWNVQFI